MVTKLQDNIHLNSGEDWVSQIIDNSALCAKLILGIRLPVDGQIKIYIYGAISYNTGFYEFKKITETEHACGPEDRIMEVDVTPESACYLPFIKVGFHNHTIDEQTICESCLYTQ